MFSRIELINSVDYSHIVEKYYWKMGNKSIDIVTTKRYNFKINKA